jgi:hypothetical protein
MKKLVIALALFSVFALGCTHAADHRVGLNLGKQLAPIQLLTGSNNDINIAPNGNTSTYLRFLVNSAGSTLSGMSATTVGDGDQFVVRNDSTTGNLTLTNEDTASLAGNRFLTPGAVTVQIPPRSGALVEYDATAVRWIASVVAPANPTFTGNVTANGSGIPVLTSCGTSPTITAGSTAFAGTYTTGSAATTCTLTFATPFGVAPSCLIVNNTAAAALVPTYSESTTALTVTVDVASTAYRYICVGH